jgi:hypothetical protein
MRKPVAWVLVLVAACACGSALGASPRGVPHRYIPGSLDAELQTVVRADGVAFGAWSYRSGAEYDIAVSRWDEPGSWSEPEFFGARDGRDQIQPALAVDASGNVYLAYADRADGSIKVSVLRAAGDDGWAQPLVVRAGGRMASHPALRVVAGHVVLAFLAGNRVEIVELPSDRDGQPPVGRTLWSITESGDPVENRPLDEGLAPAGPAVIGDGGPSPQEFAPLRNKPRY